MGLDIIAYGAADLKRIQLEDPTARLMVSYLIKHLPDAIKGKDIGEVDEALKAGMRVGRYSDLHILRGLAVAVDNQAPDLANLSEDALSKMIEACYESNAQTSFKHLINHSDAEGFYVPYELPDPLTLTGRVKDEDGEEEEVFVSVGASPGLLAELDRLGPCLGLDQDMGQLGEERFSELAATHKWPTAAYVWGVLRWFARESTQRVVFVQFC